MAKMPKPEEMIASRASFPDKSWMDVKTEIKPGMYAYPAKVEIMEGLHMPHPHAWQPEDEDWNLPENWEEIIYKALKERLAKHRSLKIFMDTCVRCGACADKCHFFLGTNDPKNMPVLRAELLRSVYRRDFTTAGRLLGKVAGARKLTTDVIKEWFTYFYQCTECRRCSCSFPPSWAGKTPCTCTRRLCRCATGSSPSATPRCSSKEAQSALSAPAERALLFLCASAALNASTAVTVANRFKSASVPIAPVSAEQSLPCTSDRFARFAECGLFYKNGAFLLHEAHGELHGNLLQRL